MDDSTTERYGCSCGRTDLKITANSRLRKHTADGRRRSDTNPYCPDTNPLRVKPCGCRELGDGTTEDCDVCRVPDSAEPPGGDNPAASVPDPETLYGAMADCKMCQHNLHGCPGCGEPVDHGVALCENCKAPVAALEPASGAFLMGTARSASDDHQDAMDALMAEDRPGDGTEQLYRNGRYALPDPVTGVARTWTRATTMAGTISDLYSLNLWKIRMTLIGVTRYPCVLDELREIEGDDTDEQILSPKIHRNMLNRVGLRAQDMAGAKVPANWGTEMHGWIEAMSREEVSLEEVPEKYRREVGAYMAAMASADLSPVPDLIERVICVPLYGTAGRFDQAVRVHRSRSIRLGSRIVRLRAGDMIIGDAKSGRDLDYGWGEISTQLSIYAHGLKEGRVARWNPEGDDGEGAWGWEPLPVPVKSVRTDVGVVMHVPVQREEGEPAKCTLYWVDLEAGWSAVQLCEAVRDWRQAKGLHTPFSIAEVPTSVPGELVDDKPVVRSPRWEERFSGVTTREQARTVYREYLAAGGKQGTELDRLVGLARSHLAQLAEETA